MLKLGDEFESICNGKILFKQNNLDLIRVNLSKFCINNNNYCFGLNHDRVFLNNNDAIETVSHSGVAFCMPTNNILFFRPEKIYKGPSYTYVYKSLLT